MKQLAVISIIISLVLATELKGQTGPGGVGSSSNNVMWLDANRMALSHGSAVSQWTDFSGNGNNVTQGVGSYQPTFLTSSSFLNGNHIQFQGDYLETGSISAMNSNKITLFTVAAPRINHTGIAIRSSYASGAGSSSDRMWGTYSSKGGGGQFATHSRTSSGSEVGAQSGYSTTRGIYGFVWNGASPLFEGYKNGGLLNSSALANANPSGHQRVRIGANSGSLGLFFDGYIAEIIVYNTSLNSAQRIIVENYLGSKYGISVSNERYVYDSGYKNDVIGIGQEADGNNLTARGNGILELSSSSLSNGDYVMAGHDGVSLSNRTGNVPATISGYFRWTRKWRVDPTGTAGNIDVKVYVSGGNGWGQSGTYYLVTDADDGDFSNGNAYLGSFNSGDSSITFTSVPVSEGMYLSLANQDAIRSIASGYWHKTTTWNCGCVPDGSVDVIIESGHTVELRTNQTVSNLTINSGGMLNPSSSAKVLTVSQDLLVNGKLQGVGGIIFDATGSHNFTNNATDTVKINGVIGNNTVNFLGNRFMINVRLSNNSGALNNSATEVILSTTGTQMSQITQVTGTGLTGSGWTLQRYVTSRNAAWANLSSPVNGSTIQDWDQRPGGASEIYMSGVGGVDGFAGGWYSVYRYNATSQVYDTVKSVSDPLSSGRGYELWLADNLSSLNNFTFDTRGLPNFGNISANAYLSSSSANEWSLIGNPYHSWIDWGSVSKSGLKNEFWIYDAGTGGYVLHSGTNLKIPSHQGFWVESTNGSPTCQFTESAKLFNISTTFYKKSNKPELELILASIEGLKFRSYVRIDESSTEEFDIHDARVLPNRDARVPKLNTITANGTKVMLNSLNSNALTYVLPVEFAVNNAGMYQFEFSELGDVAFFYNKILLRDKEKSQLIDMKVDTMYEFAVSEFNKADQDRFEIILTNDPSYNITTTAKTAQLAAFKSGSDNITITVSDNENIAEIQVVNVLGQTVYNGTGNHATRQLVNIPDLIGTFIVKVRTDNGDWLTSKVIL